jgi:hypothetical protein
MAKYNINQPGNRDVHSGGTATAQTKVGSFKVAAESKGPAYGSKSNKSKTEKVLTHERIAKRAWEIWMKRGCRPGEDERNWIEAETQLRAELDIG